MTLLNKVVSCSEFTSTSLLQWNDEMSCELVIISSVTFSYFYIFRNCISRHTSWTNLYCSSPQNDVIICHQSKVINIIISKHKWNYVYFKYLKNVVSLPYFYIKNALSSSYDILFHHMVIEIQIKQFFWISQKLHIYTYDLFALGWWHVWSISYC